MRETRKPSNITVIVPDFSAPIAAALEAFNKNRGDEEPATGMDFREYGYVLTENGTFALCEEGVGDSNTITDTNKLEIKLYPQFGAGFAMIPAGSIELSDTELIMLPTKREEQLEGFIRSFGSRLDRNYAIWLHHFQQNKPMKKDHA